MIGKYDAVAVQLFGASGGGGGPSAASISGTTTLGSVLSVTGLPTGFTPATYQWRRDGVNISGATSSTYTVTALDGGTTVSVVVTGAVVGRSIPAIPDTTKPTLISAAVGDATRNRADFTYSETLDATSVPATSAYTLPGKTVTGVAVVGNMVQVTVSVAWAAGATVGPAAYVVPGTGRIRDAALNNADAFSGQAVANNIVAEGAVATTFDGLATYSGGFTPNSGTDAKTQPALTFPAKTTNILTGGYVEPVFGTEMRIITAAIDVGTTGNDAAVHDYSSQQAFNADSTKFNIQSRNGFHYIFDAATNTKIDMGGVNAQGLGAIVGMAGNCEPCWHPTDPNILYYTGNGGGMIRYQLNVSAKTSSVYKDFTTLVRALPGMSTAGLVWSAGEGRVSDDGNRWGHIVATAGGSTLGMVVYERSTDSILRSWQFTNAPNWVSISPSGLYIVGSWYGSSAGSLAAETARALNAKGGANVFRVSDGANWAISCIGEHSDMAWGYDGKEVYLSVSFSPGDGFVADGCMYMRNLEDPSVQTEFPVRVSGGTTGTQMHFSGRAIRRKGWGLFNKSPGVGTGAWDGTVGAVELVPAILTPKIFRLFQHRSAGGDQFASPCATVNNDFTRVLAHTQDAAGNDVDLCCLLPSFALPVAGARAPIAQGAPVLAGSATPGGTLTVTPGSYGGLPAPTVTRVMQQSANGSTGWADIGGATGTSYVVGVGNGVYLRNAETGANGTLPNATQYSNVLLVAALAAPINTVAPSSPLTSDTATPITAVAGTWTGNPTPTIAFVWQRDTGGGTWVDSAFTTRTATLTPAGPWRPKETGGNSQGSGVVAVGATVTISVPAAEPVATTVTTFNQANGTTLETIAAAWDGSTKYQVQSSALRNMDATGGGTNLAYFTGNTATNQAAKTTVKAGVPDDWSADQSRVQQVHVHANGTQNGYYVQVDFDEIRLFKNADGAPLAGPVVHGLNLAADWTIEIRQLGGRVRVYLNGNTTAAIDYTDVSPVTGGSPGLLVYSGADPARIQQVSFAHGSS